MSGYTGKYKKAKDGRISVTFLLIPLSFALVELFGLCFLLPEGEQGNFPVTFGLLWTCIISGILFLLPRVTARILYGISYFLSAVYAGFQTGYYLLFSEMLWLSDFRYAAEGADYADVLLTYPIFWWLGILILIAQGVLILWKFPVWKWRPVNVILAVLVIILSWTRMDIIPEVLFADDEKIKYAGSDYGRSQSAQAVYKNMFNTHRLYRLCGLYHTLAKDIYKSVIYPLTPSHAAEQAQAEEEIRAYFDSQPEEAENSMTGILAGKNVFWF